MFLHSSEHFSPNKRTTLHKNGGALSPEWAILLNRRRVSQFQRAAPPNPLCVIITVAALIRELSPERRFAARNAVASTRLKTRARFRVGCALARAKSWHRRRRRYRNCLPFSVRLFLPSFFSFVFELWERRKLECFFHGYRRYFLVKVCSKRFIKVKSVVWCYKCPVSHLGIVWSVDSVLHLMRTSYLILYRVLGENKGPSYVNR